MQTMAEKQALEQLITQAIIRGQIDEMGLGTTKPELVQAIQKDPRFQRDGKFDFEFYNERYLPGFQLQTGTNFERELSYDLASTKLFSLLTDLYPLTKQEKSMLAMVDQTKFEFQIITVPKENKIQKTVKDENGKDKTEWVADESYNAKKLAEDLQAKWKKNRLSDKAIKQAGVREHKSGKIRYNNLNRVLRSKEDTPSQTLQAIAQLNKKDAVSDIIEDKENLYIVKLLRKENAFEGKNKDTDLSQYQDQVNAAFQRDLESSFLESLRAKADIEYNISFEPKQPVAQKPAQKPAQKVKLPVSQPKQWQAFNN